MKIDLPQRSSCEQRRSIGSHETPAFFCPPDAPGVAFADPWMDMQTGNSFEHTEKAKHPQAMRNVQLKGAHEAYQASRKRGLSVQEALATLTHHVRCAVTCDEMVQPVRAPDNHLYECQALVKTLHTWKAASPSTRQPFAKNFTLTVDRNMQQLSIACGTSVAQEQMLLIHMHINLPPPAIAPNLEAMEEGRGAGDVDRAEDLRIHAARAALGVFNGVGVGLVLHAFGAPPLASSLGGLFLLGATVVPMYVPTPLWAAHRRP